VLNADVVEQFRSGRRGSHLLRGDDGYDAARKIYNAMIDHRPAIIARCAGVADVIDAGFECSDIHPRPPSGLRRDPTRPLISA
jgi:hypothetical protein